MLNHKKRIIDLVETYVKQKGMSDSFKKHKCISRPDLILAATQSGIPITQIERYVSLMKAFEVISEFTQNFMFAGYIFNEKKFKEFKEKDF